MDHSETETHIHLSLSDQHHNLHQHHKTFLSTPLSPKRPWIHYETLVWIIFGTLSILACVDRFTLNVWPREIYSIGAGSAGSDFKDGLKKGPWSVQVYDIAARVSGRYSILALNLLFFTMMRSTNTWLSESPFRHWVDFSNLFDANLRLHKWNGILLIVMTLVHVWSILFPSIFHGWKSKVVPGPFEWILSERTPPGFKDVDLETKTMSLQVDDVFRIVEMTLLLGILLPLSVRWLSTKWHLGIHVHRIIAILYFVDIVRRHTHPHSWILNTPFFVAWIIDAIVGMYWRLSRPEVYRKELSDDYMLLFWNQNKTSYTVGPKYYLRLKDASLLEHAHAFTGFENRRNLDLADGKSWTACLLVRIYHNKRRPRLGRKDKVSHTKRVAESVGLDVLTWGPFHGSMSENARIHLESDLEITLVAGGSAGGYLLDGIQVRGNKTSSTLTILYTSRDGALFNWFVDVVSCLMKSNKCKRLKVVVALTDGGNNNEEDNEMVNEKQREIDGWLDESFSSLSGLKKASSLRVQYGRINFEKEIPNDNVVFFQGSGGLQRVVAKGCRFNESKFIAGPAFDQDKEKKTLLDKLRMKRCFV